MSVPVVTGLTGRPLLVTAPQDDRDRIFILEQSGFIRLHHRGDPSDVNELFLDISGKVQAAAANNEMGLLGLAFDPDYAQNGFFYVNYSEGPLNGPWFTVIARYQVSGDPDVADPDSEERLLRLPDNQSNHNGGMMLFGPDRMLYISMGDGGGAHDQHGTCGNGQNLGSLLGKILRLDVSDEDPLNTAPDCGGASATYRVPAGNPLSNGTGSPCDEIWSYGLRNPWRFSLDRLTNDMFIGDVGQNCWEEVNAVPNGGEGLNYGWRQMEATHCFRAPPPINCEPAALACGASPACGDASLTIPVVEFSHAGGACSVTGGYAYRGCLLPAIAGRYFYGDFCAGNIESFIFSGGAATSQMTHTGALDPGGGLVNGLTSFGEDAEGEIYIVDRSGVILKIVPPLPALEVSGVGAADLLTVQPGPWTWENLGRTTGHPINHYRVYRGVPGSTFQCVLRTADTSWPSGDPTTPAPGAQLAYLVVALDAAGVRTSAGGTSRVLGINPCP